MGGRNSDLAGFLITSVLAGVARCNQSQDTSKCKANKADDDALSETTRKRIEALTGLPEQENGLPPSDSRPSLISADSSPCRKRALTLGPTLRRFNRYREALPYARAANDVNELGNEPGGTHSKNCLTRLPNNADELNKELGLPPGTITDRDLRNDNTGFRAEMYRDEATGKLILVARDTQRTSLVDWQTNTRNGEGRDTDQYAAMRKLSGTLFDNKIPFDVAGYSKGGGLAQEAALINTNAQAYVFNSAGLHENSLIRTGNNDFSSLEARTRAFNAENDFLTYMNNTTNPEQQIENAQFLRRELAGENRWKPDPMQINHRNPQQSDASKDQNFQRDLQSYFQEIDNMIQRMETDHAAGKPIRSFPPVRATQQETIPNSGSFAGDFFGAKDNDPNLGKLAQHQMKNVLKPMEKNIKNDRKALEAFLKECP